MEVSRLFWLAVLAVFVVVDPVFAAEGAATGTTDGLGRLGTVIGLGIAAAGGALGQGRVAASTLEGIARNPGASGQMLLPLILGLAFVESLVIFTLLVAAGWV